MIDRKAIREALRDDIATLRIVTYAIRTCANVELPHWMKHRDQLLRNIRYNLSLLHSATKLPPKKGPKSCKLPN